MVQAMMAVGILLPCLQDCKKLAREKLLVENAHGD
jgi:hypothetical protein